MHYYRYRPDTELSFKELIYNEMYFTSPEECNDPFDSKSFYEFPPDKVRWRRLLDQSLKIEDSIVKVYLLDELVTHICELPPLSLEHVMSDTFLNQPPLNTKISTSTLVNIESAIRQFISTYIPATRFFVSFAKSFSDSVMWSHYASSHKGYCLIFQPIEGKLKISHTTKKRSISRNPLRGLAPHMSYTLPDEFMFQDIEYKADVEPLNAFKCLSAFVYGDESHEDLDDIRREQQSHFQQKEQSWKYENETRLILPPPPPFLFGEHISYTNHERLFHYEPTQLVGIIFGAKMSKSKKDRIKEIVNERVEKEYTGRDEPFFKFDFVLHEAHLSQNQRTISINPIEILGGLNCTADHPDFHRRYQRWQEGYGIRFNGNSAGTVQFG